MSDDITLTLNNPGKHYTLDWSRVNHLDHVIAILRAFDPHMWVNEGDLDKERWKELAPLLVEVKQ